MSELLQYELTLPMAPDAELVAAGTTEKIALLTGFDEKTMGEVRMAVIEACINAFEHSDSPDKRVYLTFAVEEDRLLVVVRDFGKGFDPAQVEEPPLLTPRGWGLRFIKRFMDQVEFKDIAPGTELRMTKFFNPRPPPPGSPPAS
jgi:serine/threonine-protein kinase RsbW